MALFLAAITLGSLGVTDSLSRPEPTVLAEAATSAIAAQPSSSPNGALAASGADALGLSGALVGHGTTHERLARIVSHEGRPALARIAALDLALARAPDPAEVALGLDAQGSAPTPATPSLLDAMRALASSRGAALPPRDASVVVDLSVRAPAVADSLAALVVATLGAQSAGRSHDVAQMQASRAPVLAATRALELALRASLPSEPRMLLCGVYDVDFEVAPTMHACDVALSVDEGGNDVYTNNAGGATGSLDEPGAVLVDLGGDDLYEPPSTTDSRGLIGGGFEGAGFLYDAGQGNDTYVASAGPDSALIGSGSTGAGMLVDEGGNDNYVAMLPARGAAIGSGAAGSGILVDEAGDDHYVATASPHASLGNDLAANGGSVDGVGILVDESGNDTYVARGGAGAANGAAAGGLGVLVDRAGNDAYTATFSDKRGVDGFPAETANGAGDAGVGLLDDGGGDDVYDAHVQRGAVNGASLSGVGILLDSGGSNTFRGFVDQIGAADGAADGGGNAERDEPNANGNADVKTIEPATVIPPSDGVYGILLAGDGKDVYDARGTSEGAARGSAEGILDDAGGSNSYSAGEQARWMGFTTSSCAFTFDPATTNWSLATDLTPGATPAADAVWLDNKAILVGRAWVGFLDSENVVVEYDPASDTAHVLSDQRVSLTEDDLSAVVHDGKIYYLGGDAFQSMSPVRRYDPATQTLSVLHATYPDTRPELAAVDDGSDVLMFGAYLPITPPFIPPNDQTPRDVLKYDVANDTILHTNWTLPAPRYGMGAVWTGNDVYLLGGYTRDFQFNTKRVDSILRFDPTTGNFTTMNATVPFWYVDARPLWDGHRIMLVDPLGGIAYYDPMNDTMSPETMFPTSPLSVRTTAVWTGSRVVVFNTGACGEGFAQGAGGSLGTGLLVDEGAQSAYKLGAHVTGDGAGVQGAGVLVQSNGASFVSIDAAASARLARISGGGVGLTLAAGSLAFLDQAPDLACAHAAPPLRTFKQSLPGLDVDARVCPVDQSSSEPIREPISSKPFGALNRSLGDQFPQVTCDTIGACDLVTALLGPRADGWIASNETNATTSGGFELLSIAGDVAAPLPNGVAGHSMSMKFVAASADDECDVTCSVVDGAAQG